MKHNHKNCRACQLAKNKKRHKCWYCKAVKFERFMQLKKNNLAGLTGPKRWECIEDCEPTVPNYR